MQGISVT